MALLENMNTEKVNRLSLRTAVCCGGKDTVRTAIERMRTGKLGCAIIVDAEQKPIGMFTESMVTQIMWRQPDAIGDPVEKHMADKWPWVTVSDPIVDVLDAMQAKNVRFICVVDKDGRVAGVTGQKGLMEYIAEHFPEQVMVQRVGCAPYLNREGA